MNPTRIRAPRPFMNPVAIRPPVLRRNTRQAAGESDEQTMFPCLCQGSADRSAPSGPAPQSQDGEQERREEDLQADDDQGRRENRGALLGEAAETALQPLDDDRRLEAEAGQGHDAAGEQTVLESDPLLEPLEQRIVLAQVVDAVGAGAEAERDHLAADDDEQRAADQRV